MVEIVFDIDLTKNDVELATTLLVKLIALLKLTEETLLATKVMNSTAI